jgi:hypothetical protein
MKLLMQSSMSSDHSRDTTPMKVYTLLREQQIDRSLEEIFAFFSNPENLGRITPSTLRFEMLTPSPLHVKDGSLLDYTIRISGLPFRWTTLITLFEPPNLFVDVQLRGPYGYWHHKHSFRKAEKGTVVRDEVRYALPFGILGRIVHGVFVRRQLKAIFDYRAQALERIFAPRSKRSEYISSSSSNPGHGHK